MLRTGILGLGMGIALSAQAASVLYPGITTLRVTPLFCQEVSFGQDGFERSAPLNADAKFTGVLLAVDVQQAVTRDFDGKLMPDVPAEREPKGRTLLVLEGQAKDRCALLKQPALDVQVMPRYCDTLPARGNCLIPFLPLVEVVKPKGR